MEVSTAKPSICVGSESKGWPTQCSYGWTCQFHIVSLSVVRQRGLHSSGQLQDLEDPQGFAQQTLLISARLLDGGRADTTMVATIHGNLPRLACLALPAECLGSPADRTRVVRACGWCTPWLRILGYSGQHKLQRSLHSGHDCAHIAQVLLEPLAR